LVKTKELNGLFAILFSDKIKRKDSLQTMQLP
jgi:hypothetical protein